MGRRILICIIKVWGWEGAGSGRMVLEADRLEAALGKGQGQGPVPTSTWAFWDNPSKKKKLDSTVYCDCVGIKMDIYNKRHSVNIEII